MYYVDGFVAAVPDKNKEAYIRHAKFAAAIFKEYGALKLVDCWGDDIPDGRVTSFPMAVDCKPDETICFSWIIWPSKDTRNEAMRLAMTDPRLQAGENPMPFDGRRMLYGGFQMIVDV